MLMKAALMEDVTAFKRIAAEAQPKECKRLGRQVKWNDASQQKWDMHVHAVAFEAVFAKFASDAWRTNCSPPTTGSSWRPPRRTASGQWV